MVDTAENINLWHSLAHGREAVSGNGLHWRPPAIQTITTTLYQK